MTISPEFASMMTSEVTWYHHSTRDAYGKYSYPTTGTTVKCRVQRTDTNVKNADGVENVEGGRIIVYGTTGIATDDRLVLPDGLDVLVLSVSTVNDEDGPHHTVISFGNG